MREYEAYHIHSHLTNLIVPDSIVSKKDYAKRFVEIGNMHMLSTCEHSFQGDIYFANDICADIQKAGYDLRPVQVCEAYFVLDRNEKDRTNAHLILAAINDEGRKDMNYILSEANVTGFYHRPRIDMELLLSVNPSNLLVTTACIGGVWKYDEGMQYLQIIEQLRDHFGDHFFLEVQAHDTPEQKRLNGIIQGLYSKKGYQIIAATDSHFIDKDATKWRTYYLESKKIFYPEEDGWDLSLPTGDELFERFMAQGVLSAAQIEEAIKNTLVFRKCNNLELGTTYDLNKRKKVPNPRKGLTPQERVTACKRLMLDNYRKMYPDATKEEQERDFAELRYEAKVIEEDLDEGVPAADYFLLMADLMKAGIENGGTITPSGRGSMSGFVSNHLLGLTSVNRITAPVKMFPDRFISHDRIVSKNMPDIDVNLSSQAPFLEAAQKLLGEWGILPLFYWSV